MQHTMKRVKRAVAAFGLGLVTVASCSTLSASAATTDLPGFFCGTAPFEGQLTVCVKGDIELTPTGGATTDVVATCEAVVQGVVELTGVGCEIDTLGGTLVTNAPSVFVPGVVSATAPVPLTNMPIQGYRVCVGGDYTGVDGLRGGGGSTWAVFACFTTIV